MRRRSVRIGLTLLVTGLAIAYLVWKVDIHEIVDTLLDADPWWFALAVAIMIGTALPMALRWQWLMRAQRMDDHFWWLTRAYFVSYSASQVLPTSIGGDTVRIAAHARRRPEAKGEVAGAVLMERVVGSVGTLVLVAIGLVLAIGRYNNIGEVLVLEIALSVGLALALAIMFSRRTNAWLQERGGTRKLARGFRSLWEALHGYRSQPRALLVVLAATVVLQFIRIMSIWLCGEAVGIDVSPLVYIIMGPLLFLVMLIPFTINGLGVREAFFIAFLGRFGVDADAAFATGFLFYAVTVAASIPGGAIMIWDSLRPALMRPREG